MKKQRLLFIVLIVGTLNVSAQVSTPFNFGIATNYVGWNAAQAFPLQIRHNAAQPINFFTANTQRMNITSTGTVGVGQTTPLSLLHLNSNGNAIGGEVFRTTAPGSISSWRLETGGNEKFNITANGVNTFLQVTQSGGNMLFNTGGAISRMIIRDGTDDQFSGRIGMGNDLPATFAPQDRLHIHESFDHFLGIRITNSNTGSGAADGAAIRVQNGGGALRFIQFENQPIDFFTPTNTLVGIESRFRIAPNGRTYVGSNVVTLENRFTIDSEWDDPIFPDATKSGLRFVDLTSVETPVTNPGSGVLSVDVNGNVIYVPGGEIDGAHNGASLSIITPDFVTFGQDYAQAGNPGRLLNDREVPLENNEINFSGQGTVHISQGSGVLNTNAALDVSTQASGANSSIGINFSGKTSNNLVDEKGIQAAMNLNTLAANNNTALLELSNTNKQSGAAGWLIKANGFYGTGAGPDLADQASFGVLGNGNTILNGSLGSGDLNRANLFVTDFAGAANTGGNPSVSGTSARRSMLVSNTHPEGSDNFGLDVYAENTSASSIGTRTFTRALGASSNATALHAETFTDNATNPSGRNTAIVARSNSTGAAPQNFGVDVKASGSAKTNVGVYSVVDGASSLENIGLDGVAAGSLASNYGVRGKTGAGGAVNYGLHGTAANGSAQNVSVFAGAPSGPGVNYAGYFDGYTYIDGDLYVNGDITASGTITPSDAQFKLDVQPIEGALSIISQLQPKTYKMDTLTYPNMRFESDEQMGLIAQEVELILPALISSQTKMAQYDSLGNETEAEINYKGLEYEEFIPLLIAGMKEQQSELNTKDSVIASQQSQLDDLNSRLSQLESCLSALLPSLCEANQMAVQQTPEETQRQLKQKLSITLTDKNTVVLTQNVPNPFAETTTISYNIPAAVQQAQIHFYNAQGKLIHSVEITERGSGELTIFASDLSSGMYSYSLVADGKIVATKKMVKL
ncbi:MAG: tail fiber domain-containing protein [Bacteroidota bacterium]